MGSYMNFKNFSDAPPASGSNGKPQGNYPLARQPSVYSLTFDEFQNTLGGFGKDFGSMNMDELLKNIWTAEETQAVTSSAGAREGNVPGGNLQRQGSLTLPRTLSQKTVDEVWRDLLIRESSCGGVPDGNGNGRIVNGNQVELTNLKSDGPTYLELQVSELTGAEKHLEEDWAASMEKLTLTTAEEEQVLVSDGNLAQYQAPDNGQSVNSAKLTCTEYQVSKPSESERNIEEKLSAPEAIVNPMAADVMVEVFPLLPITVTVDNLNGSSLGEARDLNNPLEEKEIEKVELEPGNGCFLSDGMNSMKNSNLGDDKSVANLSGSVDKEVVEDLVEPSFEDSNCSAPGEGIKDDSHDVEVFEAKVYRNDVGTPQPLEKGQVLAEAEALSAPNNVHTNILNGTYTGSSSGEVNVPRMSVNQPKADVQCSGNSQKGSNPTLDRINLESWKTTRRSGKPENNPLLDAIKAFVVAFIKFWTE